MAGSGKTTLMQRLNAHLHAQKKPGYVLNLDPAVTDTPYEPNIDIRDTVGAERHRRCPGLKLHLCWAPSGSLLLGPWRGLSKGWALSAVFGKRPGRPVPVHSVLLPSSGDTRCTLCEASCSLCASFWASSRATQIAVFGPLSWSAAQITCAFLAGQLQKCHEAVQPGPQWRHPDLPQPVCHTL